MSNVDWSGFWSVFSGMIAVYVIAKALYNACFDLWEKRLWRRYMSRGAGVLVILTSCTTSRVPVIEVPGTSPSAYAHTTCDVDGYVAILIYEDAPKGDERKYLMAHEHEHVRQVHAYGDCLGFMTRYGADAHFRLRMEGLSECASIQLVLADGFKVDGREVIDFLHTRHPFTDAEIVEALPCIVDSTGKLRGGEEWSA